MVTTYPVAAWALSGIFSAWISVLSAGARSPTCDRVSQQWPQCQIIAQRQTQLCPLKEKLRSTPQIYGEDFTPLPSTSQCILHDHILTCIHNDHFELCRGERAAINECYQLWNVRASQCTNCMVTYNVGNYETKKQNTKHCWNNSTVAADGICSSH